MQVSMAKEKKRGLNKKKRKKQKHREKQHAMSTE